MRALAAQPLNGGVGRLRAMPKDAQTKPRGCMCMAQPYSDSPSLGSRLTWIARSIRAATAKAVSKAVAMKAAIADEIKKLRR